MGRSHSFACLFGIALIGSFARTAKGAPEEDVAARSLRAQAIDKDFLAMDFAAAEQKLTKALEGCGDGRCSASLRALLYFDLGAVAVAGKKTGEALAHFARALENDPDVAPDDDVATPEMKRLFAEVKSAAAAPKAPPETPPKARPVEAARAPAEPSAEDCPPGFPGCASRPSRDSVTPGEAAPESTKEAKRNWIGLAFEQNLVLAQSADGACSGGSGYTCFSDDGTYYSEAPLSGADNKVEGGLTRSTSRITAGYDRRFGSQFTAGVRLGYAFGGGPDRPSGASFLPVHFEARVAYWFGRDPFVRSGLRPFAVVAGGMGQFDASVPVTVYSSEQAYRSGDVREVQAWKKGGQGFGALGLGAMLPLSESSGIVAEAKMLQAFPTPATGFGLQLGYVVGL